MSNNRIKNPRIILTDSLEGFIVIATCWVAFLSLAFGLFGILPSQIDRNSFNIDLFNRHINTYMPEVVGTKLNIVMMIVSPLLCILGIYNQLNPTEKLIKLWLMLIIPFWGVQTLALISLGFYPLGAGYTALFLGASIFLYSEHLHRTE